jgi:hypothetical protein
VPVTGFISGLTLLGVVGLDSHDGEWLVTHEQLVTAYWIFGTVFTVLTGLIILLGRRPDSDGQ